MGINSFTNGLKNIIPAKLKKSPSAAGSVPSSVTSCSPLKDGAVHLGANSCSKLKNGLQADSLQLGRTSSSIASQPGTPSGAHPKKVSGSKLSRTSSAAESTEIKQTELPVSGTTPKDNFIPFDTVVVRQVSLPESPPFHADTSSVKTESGKPSKSFLGRLFGKTSPKAPVSSSPPKLTSVGGSDKPGHVSYESTIEPPGTYNGSYADGYNSW